MPCMYSRTQNTQTQTLPSSLFPLSLHSCSYDFVCVARCARDESGEDEDEYEDHVKQQEQASEQEQDQASEQKQEQDQE